MTAQQIAGKFYQQSNGTDLILSAKQLAWIENTAKEQRTMARGEIDTTGVVIDDCLVGTYDIVPVDAHGTKNRRWKMVFFNK